MTPWLLALGVLTAAPAERTRVLVFDVKPTGGVAPETAENLTGLIAAILSEDPRLEVLAGPDLRSMLEIEGQKQALGCTEDTSCVAEAAGALGAKYVVIGNVGHLGQILNLNVSLFDQSKGSSVARRAVQVKSLDEIPVEARPALRGLVAEAIGAAPVAEAPPPAAGPDLLPWIVVGAGGVAVLAGGGMLSVALAQSAAVSSEEENFRKGDTNALDRAIGIQQQWFENGLAPGLGIGGAALAVAGLGAVGGGLFWALGEGGGE